ncbi:MAG TPA: hypothetical protein GXX59_09010 [Syntrophomonadaceae bacterium]|nr:hypothetical protein [Syntrophomonadaceae bacterium]
MAEGRVKMVFPGGNTCLGFYSFYNYIIGEEAQRIWVLKGGPGTGKSTFMKQIGKELLERGFDLEFHWCSSDHESLDALTIPRYQLAILDGTEPHVVDPCYPGAVDEIVNLGDYLDQTKLVPYKEEIISLRGRVKHQFATTYSSLRMAKLARDEEISCHEEALDYQCFHRLTGELFRQIFGQNNTWGEGSPDERHLFASALTPKGIIHYLPSLLDGITFLYLLEGDPGSGKEMILRELAEYAYRCGFTVDVYHCAFDPAQIDLVVLPERKIAVLNLFKELDFNTESLSGLRYCERIDCNTCLDDNLLTRFDRELRESRELFNGCLQRALYYLKEARTYYQQMENYYREAMDFDAVENRRKELFARILKLIDADSHH